jgi:hypothetical protein
MNTFTLANADKIPKAKSFCHLVHSFRKRFLALCSVTALMSGIVKTRTSLQLVLYHLALYSTLLFLQTISLALRHLLNRFINFLPPIESHLSKLNYSTFTHKSLDLLLSSEHVRRRLEMPMPILTMIRLLFSHPLTLKLISHVPHLKLRHLPLPSHLSQRDLSIPSVMHKMRHIFPHRIETLAHFQSLSFQRNPNQHITHYLQFTNKLLLLTFTIVRSMHPSPTPNVSFFQFCWKFDCNLGMQLPLVVFRTKIQCSKTSSMNWPVLITPPPIPTGLQDSSRIPTGFLLDSRIPTGVQ